MIIKIIVFLPSTPIKFYTLKGSFEDRLTSVSSACGAPGIPFLCITSKEVEQTYALRHIIIIITIDRFIDLNLIPFLQFLTVSSLKKYEISIFLSFEVITFGCFILRSENCFLHCNPPNRCLCKRHFDDGARNIVVLHQYWQISEKRRRCCTK